MEIKTPDRMVSIAETRSILGIGNTSLYGLLKEGKIAARKIGGRTLIPESELRAFQDRLPPARGNGKAA